MVKTSFKTKDGQHTANQSPNVRPMKSPYFKKGFIEEHRTLVKSKWRWENITDG